MGLCDQVRSARQALVATFQLANIILLLGCVTDNPYLVQIYLCFTLGFVVLGLLVELLEFLLHTSRYGPSVSLVLFIPEVAFFFALCMCLPLVDEYRKQLTTNIMQTSGIELKSTGSQSSSFLDPHYSGIKLEVRKRKLW